MVELRDGASEGGQVGRWQVMDLSGVGSTDSLMGEIYHFLRSEGAQGNTVEGVQGHIYLSLLGGGGAVAWMEWSPHHLWA